MNENHTARLKLGIVVVEGETGSATEPSELAQMLGLVVTDTQC